MKERLVTTKINRETNEKLKQTCRLISVIENKKVTNPELLRRITNIPNLTKRLVSDAELKRRFSSNLK